MLSIGTPMGRTDLRNIHDKLHMRSRAEAVARLLKCGESVCGIEVIHAALRIPQERNESRDRGA